MDTNIGQSIVYHKREWPENDTGKTLRLAEDYSLLCVLDSK
jgi:hypothetical protein